jgi:hypothetical protein
VVDDSVEIDPADDGIEVDPYHDCIQVDSLGDRINVQATDDYVQIHEDSAVHSGEAGACHPTAGRGHPGEATHHRRDHAGAGSGRSSLHRGWNTARRSVRTIERIATEYAAPWRRLLAAVTLRGRDEWLRARAGEADGDRREHDDGKHTRADECCGVLGQHHA